MTKDLVCIQSTDVVTKARSMIRDHGFRALPVLEDDELVGVLSRGDILKITSSKTNIPVEGVMNRNPVKISGDSDLFTAARSIVKSGVRQLLVMDNKTLLGIISSIDVLNNFVNKNYSPPKKKINEVMNTEVVYCEQDDEISKIWDLMHSSGFSGLPVVKDSKVIGMVTRMNILKHGSVRLSKESGRIRNASVKKVMKTPAVTVTPTTDVKEAAGIMVDKKIIRLPVVDKEKTLEGIVDIEDVLRAYVG
ncbi:MAG: CBS domain-containing protein [Candidatus Altiarchaeota archaeon]|nr:CBS domain-containing protein [Candidatus Altiarchaeota archaeon]